MLDTLRELTRQLRLKMLMINTFIPPEVLPAKISPSADTSKGTRSNRTKGTVG